MQLEFPPTYEELEKENKELKEACKELYELIYLHGEELSTLQDKFSDAIYGNGDVPSDIFHYRKLFCDHSWKPGNSLSIIDSRVVRTELLCKECGAKRRNPDLGG